MTFAVSTLVFEVETGGSDSNAGGFDPGVSSPGTDYSQQASPQVTYTDLVIGTIGNEAQLTSAAHPFGSTSPGNVINITGGTGFSTGLYRILSVAGTTATMDRAVGTASSTGGAGVLGGAFATPNFALGKMTVAGMTTYIKSGTYQITSALTSPTTANGTSVYRIVGYSSTRGDSGQATIQLNANSINVLSWNVADTSVWSFENLTFDGNNKTTVNGIDLGANNNLVRNNFINCLFKNFTGNYALRSTAGAISVIGCEFSSNAFADTIDETACLMVGGHGANSLNVTNSYFAGNSASSPQCEVIKLTNAGLGATPGLANISRCIIYNNTGTNMNGIRIEDSLCNIENCIIHSNTLNGIIILSGNDASNVSITNNIITSNTTGINVSLSSTPTLAGVNHNAYYNNSSAAKTGFTAGTGEVTLTGLPYNNVPTDFSLNTTAGQGAACRAAAIPGTLGVSSVVGTGYLDIGPLQHKDPTTTVAYPFVA